MVSGEYFSIPTSPQPSPPMSALNMRFGDDKGQQYQRIPLEITSCSDTSMIHTNSGPTRLDCNLQQKDALSAPWSSHYDHHFHGKSHSEELLAATGSPSSLVLKGDQWDRNFSGRSKCFPFNASEISYPKCTSTDSGSCSSSSPTKTKCPADETDWDGLDANMELPKEMEVEETPTTDSAEINQQKRKMKRFRYVARPILIQKFRSNHLNTQ
jgi:hypothetical protein